MTRDPIESLHTIRRLCNELFDNKEWKKIFGELSEKCKKNPALGRNPYGLLGQIEWICRHALEDYDIFPTEADIKAFTEAVFKISNFKVTVITGKSESGDDYGPWVFDNKPSDQQLEIFLRKECAGDFPEEGEKGPGIFGSYIHINVNEVEMRV